VGQSGRIMTARMEQMTRVLAALVAAPCRVPGPGQQQAQQSGGGLSNLLAASFRPEVRRAGATAAIPGSPTPGAARTVPSGHP